MKYKVGEFEKVTFNIFKRDFEANIKDYPNNDLEDIYAKIILPSRATVGSAGYDFKSPFDFNLSSGETITIPTGIRVKIDEGWWLGILPRSGHGFKYRIQLDNTMGVIDSDYYNADNEGHILIKITNDSKTNKTLTIEQGTGIAQSIFLPYGITYSDSVDGIRSGGFGSTDK